MRNSVLHSHSNYVDPFQCKPGLLTGESKGGVGPAGVYERLCPSTPGVLERRHLRSHVLVGVPRAV